MLATPSPFPQFFDADGSPLDNGELFYGFANLNPETNPLVVYWDAAGTQPAAQPIKVMNGYPVRNGTPTNIYSIFDYSLSVRDRRGRLVYYVPSSVAYANDLSLLTQITTFISNVASTAGAALVGWIRSATGAIGTTVAGWMGYQRVNAFDFFNSAQKADALAGTLLVDCGAAMQNALNAVGNWGCLQLPGGVNIRSDLQLDVGLSGQSVVINGDNSIITLCANQNYLINMPGIQCRLNNVQLNLKPGVTATAAIFAGGLQHVFDAVSSRDQKWQKFWYTQNLKESKLINCEVKLDVSGSTGDIIYSDYSVGNTIVGGFFGFCDHFIKGSSATHPVSGYANEGWVVSGIHTVFCKRTIDWDRVTSFKLVDSVIDFCETWGLFASNGNDILVSGNWIASNLTNGFLGVGALAAVSNVKVTNNTFVRGAAAITGTAGVSLTGPNCKVTGNDFTTGMNGGTITDPTGRSHTNTVASPGIEISTVNGNLGPWMNKPWTPVVKFGGVDITTTGGAINILGQTGYELGNELVCRMRLMLSAKGASAGAITIEGLPRVCNGSYHGSVRVVSQANMGAPLAQVGRVVRGTSTLIFFLDSAILTQATDTAFTNTTEIFLEFNYQYA